MRYNFFHLSDLHFRSGWDEENGLVCKYLLDDVASEAKALQNSYVVFTGDVVFSGDESTYYSEFVKRFSPKLDSLGLDKSRRIVIPGNHDVQRIALKGTLTPQMGAVAAANTERSFNDHLPHFESQYFSAKFKNYCAFEADFSSLHCCSRTLGGAGLELSDGLGIYCLNTALASCGGLDDETGKPISDKAKLPVATRLMHNWLENTDYKTRILLAHHPLDWLVDWASTELGRTINSSFHLVLTGHMHTSDAYAITRSVRRTVFCAAPALFTRKSQTLAYSIIGLDTDIGQVTVKYRQWLDEHRRYVAGSAITGTDSGTVSYTFHPEEASLIMSNPAIPTKAVVAETLSILESEFSAALHNYSSKPLMWVERDLASAPETDRASSSTKMFTPGDLAKSPRDCIIRAPRECGLTCVGTKIALEYFLHSEQKDICLYLDRSSTEAYRRAVEEAILQRQKELKAEGKKIAGFVVDNWERNRKGQKFVELLSEVYPGTFVILLERVDPLADLQHAIGQQSFSHGEQLYLWALTQGRVRGLVEDYVKDIRSLDPDTVTRKIINDIEMLNIFRTPHNCLMFLRLAEQAFDDSPVNRTELIHRVLFLLFYRYDKIPTYASRPDLKDCEYVLGNFCEWLIRESKATFTKHEFFAKGIAYCEENLIGVEVDILFSFLLSTKIFIVVTGTTFQFRFIYWLYYFAAHRMHHSPDFAKYILSDRRYATMPEVVEFYTGIDRRREDAVRVIASDLEKMANTVTVKTGIPITFNPLSHAKWKPAIKDIEALKGEIANSIVNSTLAPEIRDAFADSKYDWSRPYIQQVSTFVDEAALRMMWHATKGAARALRNSDHVPPAQKIELFNSVMNSWSRVAQVIALISPILAAHDIATCEGMSFALVGDFGSKDDLQSRWLKILMNLPFNILNWFEDDLYSTKLNPLFRKYISDHQGGFAEALLLILLIRRRPEGWEKEVKRFMSSSPNDSLALFHVFSELRSEKRLGFVSEADHERMNHLSALALAKHDLKADDPNRDQLRAAAKALGDPLPPSSSELRHQKPPERNRKK